MKLFFRKQAKPPSHALPVSTTVPADQALTGQLWSCVSLSRSQYNTHYVTATDRFGRYFQSHERLNAALRLAIDQLQQSLICRLPHDRDREESARFEQVWKFTCFLQPLLTEAMAIDRRWYKKDHQETATFIGAAYYRDHPGAARQPVIKLNLSHFLHPVSSDWLLQDDLRCIDLLYKTLEDASERMPERTVQKSNGNTARTPSADNQTHPSTLELGTTQCVTKRITDLAADRTPVNEEDTSLQPSDSSSLCPETRADLFMRFMAWLPDDARLLKDDYAYIESPNTIEQFIEENDLTVSVGDVQQSLLNHGFTRELITLGKKKRISCLRVPEEAHV